MCSSSWALGTVGVKLTITRRMAHVTNADMAETVCCGFAPPLCAFELLFVEVALALGEDMMLEWIVE